MAAAEFGLCATGMTVLALNAMNGFLNAGTSTELLLAVGGCPHGSIVAGGILVLDLPGDICPCASAANGLNVTVECGTLALIPNDYWGYSNSGSPCQTPDLCFSFSVEDESWGSTKSLYR